MSEKIIMLDFDGVLLPKKSYLTEKNKKILSELEEKLEFFTGDSFERNKLSNNYIIDLNFEETAIQLVNRLCRLANAKVVILSNWRRRFKPELLKEKLINSGLLENYLHEEYYCHYKMNSGKNEEFLMWRYQNDKNNEKEYIIVDDHYVIDDYDKSVMQVYTNFDDGFTVNEYRLAAGYFGVEDKEYDVYQLSEDEMDRVSKYFYTNRTMYEELYLLSRNKGYSAPKATLLSYAAAVDANKNNLGYSFMGLPSYSDEEFYKIRSEKIWNNLELLYGNRWTHHRVLEDLNDLKRFNIRMSDIDKHPKKYPCLIKDIEKTEYMYAPKGCRDEIDYLNGFAAAMF